MEKCVYCLCVFGKPEYFQGAATLAQTIRQSNTRHDILLMVTEDVRQSVIRKDLYDHIVTVPYITTKIMTRMSAKQKALYETFMHHMPIKFNGIRVAAELGYRKVLLLDVDMIFVDNCDNIFELPTPATCWRMYNGISPELDKYRHGDFVPGNIISDKLRRGLFLGSGGLMLLEASINTYNNVISYLDTIDFSKNAFSPNVRRLTKLTSATAVRLGVRNRFQIEENVRGGVEYLAWLTHLFGGDLKAGDSSLLRGRAPDPREGTRILFTGC